MRFVVPDKIDLFQSSSLVASIMPIANIFGEQIKRIRSFAKTSRARLNEENGCACFDRKYFPFFRRVDEDVGLRERSAHEVIRVQDRS